MTQSGPHRGDEAGPEQEGIWEEPRDAATAPGSVTTASSSASAGRSRSLTDSITSTARIPGPAGHYLADVPNRIMALIIDIIVLSVIGFMLAWLFGGLITAPGAIGASGSELDMSAFLVVLLLQLVISLGYFGASWTLLSATAGMRLLGLRIGGEADGGPIGARRATTRWLILGIPALLASMAVYVPNIIGVILSALGAAWLLLLLYTVAQSSTKQGLHDRFAHTILVKARRRST